MRSTPRPRRTCRRTPACETLQCVPAPTPSSRPTGFRNALSPRPLPAPLCSMANWIMSTIFEPTTGAPAFRFDNSFARDLQRFYVPLRRAVVPAPRLLFLNEPLADELGL